MSEHNMQAIARRAVAALERIADALEEAIADNQDVGDHDADADEVGGDSLSRGRGRIIGRGNG